MNPLLLTDGYKLSHREQYPAGTSLVYSNWTPRKSRIEGINEVVCFGLQYFIKEYLIKRFKKDFFDREKGEVISEYKRVVESYLGAEYNVDHIIALHDLGYLPLEIKALPEGTLVPIKCPMFTIKNTKPEFFWLVNYLETLISNVVWQPMTSATISHQYRKIFERWAKLAGTKTDIIPGILSNIDIQGHDFSMRGMGGVDASIVSGMGHAVSFKGSDTLPVMVALDEYYNAQNDFKICSVPATEHSVMCAGTGVEGEFETFKRLITQTYPNGVISIVSDTFDLWQVCTDFLPRLKNEILARNGKVVIRPDSGNPIDILCGTLHGTTLQFDEMHPSAKGVIELLWDVFGGSIENGLKVLHPCIGAIYGDSITMDRADEICRRLMAKGFAPTNWVAGIGSYTYQYNTRDTFGFAMKATYVEVKMGERATKGYDIFKDPVTDDGTKKSARGLMTVYLDENLQCKMVDQCTWEDEAGSMMQIVFKDGVLVQEYSLKEIREALQKNYE